MSNAAGKSPYANETVRRMIYEPDRKTLEKISEQAKDMLENRDYEGVGRLLRRYSESEDAVSRIAMHMHRADLSRTPEQAAQRDIVELFGRLSDTYLMRQGGHNPEETAIPQVMAAKHTYMLSHYAKEHPDNGIVRPEVPKVEAALRILDGDTQTREKTVSELYAFLMTGDHPSMYVQLRYGMAEDCKLCKAIEKGNPEDLKGKQGNMPDFTVLSARLTRTAEKAFESICHRPPNPYLEQLNGELEKLERLAVNPKSTDDLFIYNDFLVKYGIDRKSPEDVRVRQAESAYRELDKRFVRMTGRRPFADELFGANRLKTGVAGNDGDRALRNKPKGRRMGM